MSLNIFKWIKDINGTYNNFNDWVSSKSSGISSIIIGQDINLTGNLVIPENIDIAGFSNNARFSGSYTLTINKMSAQPVHQIFDDSVNVIFNPRSTNTIVNTLWFGSGITAKNKLISGCGFGGVIFYDSEETEPNSELKFINSSGTVLTMPLYNPLEI